MYCFLKSGPRLYCLIIGCGAKASYADVTQELYNARTVLRGRSNSAVESAGHRAAYDVCYESVNMLMPMKLHINNTHMRNKVVFNCHHSRLVLEVSRLESLRNIIIGKT